MEVERLRQKHSLSQEQTMKTPYEQLTQEQIERAIADPESSVTWTDEQWKSLCKMALRYQYLRNNLSANGPQISEWNPIVQVMDRVPLHHADEAIDRAIEAARVSKDAE